MSRARITSNVCVAVPAAWGPAGFSAGKEQRTGPWLCASFRCPAFLLVGKGMARTGVPLGCRSLPPGWKRAGTAGAFGVSWPIMWP